MIGDTDYKLKLVEFNEKYMDLSFEWLNDEKVKRLIDSNGVTKSEQSEFYKNLPNRSDYIIFGVEIEGHEVGVCGLKNIEDMQAELFCYFGVLEYAGKGWGTVLLQKICKYALSIGLNSIHLKVLSNNIRAIKSYQKNEFSLDCIRDKFTHMSKTL